MIHFFDSRIAERVGVSSAVVLNNLWYWVRHNEANETNFHEGRYWTYNSISAYSKLFPYLTIKQLRTCLDKLVDAGIIMKGNFNENRYDRTSWYAFTDFGYSIMLHTELDLPQWAKSDCPTGQVSFAPQGEPIPNNKHIYKTESDSKQDIMSDSSKSDDAKEIVRYLNEVTGQHYKDNTPNTVKLIKTRMSEGFTVDDFKTVIDNTASKWMGDKKMEAYLRPQTLFGTKFESYLNMKCEKKVGDEVNEWLQHLNSSQIL